MWLDRHWAWAPGPVVRRPVYAPALVAFVGGAGFSVAATRGPAVGWFPLGWREPFVPWYRASSRHVHNVNVTHVTNVTTVTTVNYVNRGRPDAVTVVSQQAFVSSRPAWRERHHVGREELVRAEVIRNRVPAEPVRASFGPERPGAAAAGRAAIAGGRRERVRLRRRSRAKAAARASGGCSARGRGNRIRRGCACSPGRHATLRPAPMTRSIEAAQRE